MVSSVSWNEARGRKKESYVSCDASKDQVVDFNRTLNCWIAGVSYQQAFLSDPMIESAHKLSHIYHAM